MPRTQRELFVAVAVLFLPTALLHYALLRVLTAQNCAGINLTHLLRDDWHVYCVYPPVSLAVGMTFSLLAFVVIGSGVAADVTRRIKRRSPVRFTDVVMAAIALGLMWFFGSMWLDVFTRLTWG